MIKSLEIHRKKSHLRPENLNFYQSLRIFIAGREALKNVALASRRYRGSVRWLRQLGRVLLFLNFNFFILARETTTNFALRNSTKLWKMILIFWRAVRWIIFYSIQDTLSLFGLLCTFWILKFLAHAVRRRFPYSICPANIVNADAARARY